MDRLRVTPLWLAVLLVLLLAAGCGGEEESGEGEQDVVPAATTGEAEAAEAPSFELKVGALLPLTGDLASHGPSLDRAAHVAVDVINETLAEGNEQMSV